MTTRKYPWKYKPNQHDEAAIEAALRSQLYLVHEIGPTQFLIKGEDSPTKYKVTIGDDQTCSICSSKQKSGSSKTAPELCLHIYFVMLKVLRLPRTNTLVWQNSLLDTEINQILSMRFQRQIERDSRRRMETATSGGSSSTLASTSTSATLSNTKSSSSPSLPGSTRVPKRPLDADDVCPICQDDLVEPVAGTDHTLNLVYCQWSCGAQLHAKCMRVWAEHQVASLGSSSEKRLTCPMCRGNWCSSNPEEALTNEQLIRELKIKEHAPPPAAATVVPANDDAIESEDGATPSTALVLRSSPTASSHPRPSPPPPSRSAVKCHTCRKIMPISEGRFMRCVHCPVSEDYNLCRVCFLRSKGIGMTSNLPTQMLTERANHVHCFVEAKGTASSSSTASQSTDSSASSTATNGIDFPYAYGLEWLPAPVKASSISSQLAATLQSRELTQADYDLLLSLDENGRNGGRPMMNAFLTRSLPVPTIRTSSECCLCSSAILASQPLRILPCFHSVHETCLQSQLMYDLLLTCPLDHCAIFPGLTYCESKDALKRKKVVKKPEEMALEQAQRMGTLSVTANSMMFGVQGSSVGNTGISTSGRALPNEEPVSSATESTRSTTSGPSHSHHFQLTPTSLPAGAMQNLREQRAIPGGKLRTGGTAAFAGPTTTVAPGTRNIFNAPLELSGTSTSSFAPFVSDHAEERIATTNSAMRRGRPLEDRITPVATSTTNYVPSSSDMNALTIQSTSINTQSSSQPTPASTKFSHKGMRVRGSPTLHSTSTSPPVSSPTDSIDSLAIASTSLLPSPSPTAELISHDDADTLDEIVSNESAATPDHCALMIGSASGSARSSPPPSASLKNARPRVGRVGLSSSNDAASINVNPNQLLVSTSSTATSLIQPRSSSATLPRVARGTPGLRYRQTPSTPTVDALDEAMQQVSLGIGHASTNPAGTRPTASSSTRIRRGLPDRPSPSVSASPPTFTTELAPTVSGLRTEQTQPSLSSAASDDDTNPTRATRTPASTIGTSIGRRATFPSPSSITDTQSGPLTGVAAAASLNLTGSTFSALDRGENQFVRTANTGSIGKLRRGKTALSGTPQL